jgi:hypothetical protein
VIEIDRQLRNAPFNLSDTGEPPVKRNLAEVKSSQGYALFFIKQPSISATEQSFNYFVYICIRIFIRRTACAWYSLYVYN